MKEVKRKNSLRLKDFDYSLGYWYYVTILSYKRKILFGSIKDSEIKLSSFGNIVIDFWKDIPNHFNHCEIDSFVVMPNHIHGILILDSDSKGSACRTLTEEGFQQPNPLSLSTIIRSYKSAVIRKINTITHVKNKIWHRSFYDHIIRNEKDLYRIKRHIEFNPFKWEIDEYYGK